MDGNSWIAPPTKPLEFSSGGFSLIMVFDLKIYATATEEISP
jgi:hypothetical protein